MIPWHSTKSRVVPSPTVIRLNFYERLMRLRANEVQPFGMRLSLNDSTGFFFRETAGTFLEFLSR